MVNFGEKIKALRIEHKLTQQQLASQVGIAVSAISSYESGNRYPSYDVLISLARIFHVSTDFLLGVDKHKTLDIDGLSEYEIEVVTQMVELLRSKK